MRGRPRRRVEPLLDALISGKCRKQVAAEFGFTEPCLCQHLRRHVRDVGCKTLVQAVALYVKSKP